MAPGLFGRMLRQCGWVGGPGAARGDIPPPPSCWGLLILTLRAWKGVLSSVSFFLDSISFYLEKQSKITWKKKKNLLQPAKSYFIDLSLTPNIIFS